MRLQVANCDGSSCVSLNSSVQNPHVNYGAMVAGPTVHDLYNDSRINPAESGVYLDTSAGFSG